MPLVIRSLLDLSVVAVSRGSNMQRAGIPASSVVPQCRGQVHTKLLQAPKPSPSRIHPVLLPLGTLRARVRHGMVGRGIATSALGMVGIALFVGRPFQRRVRRRVRRRVVGLAMLLLLLLPLLLQSCATVTMRQGRLVPLLLQSSATATMRQRRSPSGSTSGAEVCRIF